MQHLVQRTVVQLSLLGKRGWLENLPRATRVALTRAREDVIKKSLEVTNKGGNWRAYLLHIANPIAARSRKPAGSIDHCPLAIICSYLN